MFYSLVSKKWIIIFLCALLAPNFLCVEKVYRAFIPKHEVEWFSSFIRNHSEIDVWLSTRLNNKHSNQTTFNQFKYFSEFRVHDSTLIDSNKDELDKRKVKLDVLIDDLRRHLTEKQSIQKRFAYQSESRFGKASTKVVGKYASYNDIISWMTEMAKKHPKLVQVFRIGKTFENRPIMVLKLAHKPNNKEQRSLFLYESGIHAREWISVATNVFMINRLIEQFQQEDEIVTKILNKYELYFIPVLNPDGYEFSRFSKFNRYWRKNMRSSRKQSSDYACYGVDLNRNFDFKWMVSGASANPCSEVYAGPYAGSEPETNSLMNFIMSKSPRWLSYISLHSYGAIWLSPFSYSKSHIPDDFEETCQKAMVAIRKIERTHHFKIKFGSASYELYEASGCSEDWGKQVAKINHTYVVELKPDKSDSQQSQSGFDHPEHEIAQTGLEMYDGFIEYMKSFFIKNIDAKIVKECENKLKEMQNEIKDDESYGVWRGGPEIKQKKIKTKN